MDVSPIKILLIENDENCARRIEDALQAELGHNFELAHADRLSIGLDRLAQERIQLVLLSLALPDCEGVAVVARIHEHAPHLPIIVLATTDDEALGVQTMHEGAQDYLVKGVFDGHLLVRAMRYAIERQKVEEALARERDFLNALMENLPDRIYFKDTQGRFVRLSKAVARRYHLNDPDQVVGKTDFDFFTKEHAEAFFADEQRVMETGQPLIGKRESQKLANGETTWALVTKMPFRDRHGSIIGTMGINKDISDIVRMQDALQLERDRSEQLLLNVLPAPVAERLKTEAKVIADGFADASVLFADIVSFTKLTLTMPPVELVDLLNRVFSAFDDLADQHGLEKIKTIGDAYMVAGGLPTPRSNHVEAMANMALDMQSVLKEFPTRAGEVLSMRIGLNTGPVIAGVIGKKKFIYDLWGETVNTASRMASHGLPGCIQVAQRAYEVLKGQFVFEERGEITVKGDVKFQTYLLNGRK